MICSSKSVIYVHLSLIGVQKINTMDFNRSARFQDLIELSRKNFDGVNFFSVSFFELRRYVFSSKFGSFVSVLKFGCFRY